MREQNPEPVERAIVEVRRARVACLSLKGFTPTQIARMLLEENDPASGTAFASLNSAKVTVLEDLKHLKRRWKESALRDYDALKGEQLQKLYLLERELWAAWERSKEDGEEVTTAVKELRMRPRRKAPTPEGAPPAGSNGDGHADPHASGGHPAGEHAGGLSPDSGEEPRLVTDSQVTTTRVQGRDGSPAYTSQLLNVIAEENELLGIVAKPGEQSTSPQVTQFRLHSPETPEPPPSIPFPREEEKKA
jgi:hypothetical protein